MPRRTKPTPDPKLAILRAKAKRERLNLAADRRAAAEATATLAARRRKDARAGRYGQRTLVEQLLDHTDEELRIFVQRQCVRASNALEEAKEPPGVPPGWGTRPL